MRALSILIIVALLLCMAVVPAIAQESTPEPVPTEPVEPPVEEPEPPADDFNPDELLMPADVFESIIGIFMLFAAAAGPIAQPFTTLVKTLLARYAPERLGWVPFIALAMPVLVTVFYWIANVLGVAEYYENVLRAGAAAIPYLISIIGAVTGQALVYKVLQATDAPIMGQSSSELVQDVRPGRRAQG